MKVVAWPNSYMDDVRQHAPEDIEMVVVDGRDAFLQELSGADAAITHTWEESFFAAADGIEWVQATSAGVDHFPLDAFAERGIAVTTASGVHPEPIAEHVYGALLGIERGLFDAYRRQDEAEWVRDVPGELAGDTMLIVGVGAIGAAIAEKAAAFDVTVHGIDPEQACEAVDRWYAADALHDALAAADVVVLACPLTDATRDLVGAKEFAAMRDDAILVNIARGAVVDEDALRESLERDDIRAAVLDVFREEPLPANHPFWTRDDVLVTPHNSGMTPRYTERLMDIFAENRAALERGEPMPTRYR